MTTSTMTLGQKLTQKNRVIKNIGINLLTKVLPILIGIFTLPPIMSGLGIERFGILTIFWAIIGYSSLFDLGLSRALTQMISKKIGENDLDAIPEVIWTTLLTITILSLLVTVGLFAIGPTLIGFIKVSPQYYQDALQSFYWLTLSFPGLMIIVVTTGVFEAYQRFMMLNVLRWPILIFNSIAPIFILKFSPSLASVVSVMALGRLMVAVVTVFCIARVIPGFFKKIHINFKTIPSLFKFGFWITLSNIISPLMSYMDRFVLANLLSSAVVAYYTTPYDLLYRVREILMSAVNVMFPVFGIEYHSNRERSRIFYHRTLLGMTVLATIYVLGVVFLAKPLIAMWLGADFAEKSYPCTVMIAIGFALFCINTIPMSLIQAAGHSKWTAKLELLELPFCLALMLFCIHRWGIVGAPVAMIMRLIFDTLVLHSFTKKLFQEPIDKPSNNHSTGEYAHGLKLSSTH